MVFGWFGRRGRRRRATAARAAAEARRGEARRGEAFPAGAGGTDAGRAAGTPPRGPRFEESVRLALAALSDSLADARSAGDDHGRALALAGTRDALQGVALASDDAALVRACRLFDEILGSADTAMATRLDAAQLALDTLTFLAVAGPGRQQASAASALAALERAAQRARAA